MYTQDISYDESKQLINPLYIDVRSPKEWLDGNIPGSINIPLFNDEERSEVGTIFKHIDHATARDKGLQIVAPKLQEIINKVDKLSADKTIVIYCWRGGMRSKSITSLLQALGVNVYRLVGGYKSYRSYVVTKLSEFDYSKTFVVLNGMTGVGKTDILEKLQSIGYPVLNLEVFAGHRGSTFGAVGLSSINSQKQFESLLLERIHNIGDTNYYIIEAESRRIGKVIIPKEIINSKENGIHIMVKASEEIRTKRLFDEYLKDRDINDLLSDIKNPIDSIKKKLSTSSYQEIQQAIANKDVYKIIMNLMVDYYDPRYTHAIKRYSSTSYEVDATDLDKAVEDIVKLLKGVEHEYIN
jgi:tRNA 2-selenouridine synthase